MTPKVSVVIPTYNRGKYITQALDSVLNQTYPDYEIIVIDDGSTDDTQEILKKFEGKIRSIRQENQGISKTRNRAIGESKGKYIAFLDSDDYWVSEKLEEQVRILDNHPSVGIVYARMPIVDDDGKKVGMKPAGFSGRNFKELLEIGGDLPTSTIMTRRECFEKAGLFDTTLITLEDIDMWIRIAQYYELYEIENKVLAYYRRHEEQITKNKIKVLSSTVEFDKKILRTFDNIPKDVVNKRLAANEYVLSREYYSQNKIKESFLHLTASIGRNPLLGNSFIDSKDNLFKKGFKLAKPYLFLAICSLKSLFKN